MDTDYFDAYGDLSVHTLMLRDRPRMVAYTEALRALRPLIEGRRVLDVGAGTGVLSMLCARICNPAALVAVEATPATAKLAAALVERNGLSGVVTVLNCRVEEVTGAERFDVLLSEWMGFYLFHEAMLDSVLWARDNLCVPSPLMLPSSCSLKVHAWSATRAMRESVDAWVGYCGLLDFSLVGELELQSALAVPQIDWFSPDEILSPAVSVIDLDLTQVPASFLRESEILRKPISLTVTRAGEFCGLLFWFDCRFGPSPVVLSTCPSEAPTHWKQTGILLGCRAPVEPGCLLDLTVILSREEESRLMSISIET